MCLHIFHSVRLSLQVWNSNILRDEFMGEHVIKTAKDEKMQSLECRLFGRGKESGFLKQGKLVVKIVQSRNLYSV